MKTQAVFFKSHIAHVRPMFESSWGAMLAAFSVILEQTDDDKQVCFFNTLLSHRRTIICIIKHAHVRSMFEGS